MSDTPRTDAEELEAFIGVTCFDADDVQKAYSFARQLERELTAAQAEIAKKKSCIARLASMNNLLSESELVKKNQQLVADCISLRQTIQDGVTCTAEKDRQIEDLKERLKVAQNDIAIRINELEMAEAHVERLEAFVHRVADEVDVGYNLDAFHRDAAREALGLDRVETKAKEATP